MRSLSKPALLAGRTVYPKASLGIGVYPDDAVDVDGLMQCADMAMYRAKQRGGSSHQFYTTDMTAEAESLFQLENELQIALSDNELELYYQPQLDLNSHRLAGMEALLRWRHPRRGLLSAMEFVPLAEERGLITPLGAWALRAACAQNRLWQQAGHPPGAR